MTKLIQKINNIYDFCIRILEVSNLIFEFYPILI